MKRNKKAIILVIILSSISFWLIINKRNGTIKESLKDFAVKDTATINKIFLADKDGNTITLEKNDLGKWMVNGKHLARIDAIKTLLITITKVEVKEPVPKAALNTIIKRIASKAIRCEIYQENKLIKAYYVGSETSDQTGTYMVLMDLETMKPVEKPFITYMPGFVGFLNSRYFTNEIDWRDRTVFQYNPTEIKSIRVEAPFNPENNYELNVNGNNNYSLKLLLSNKEENKLDTLAVKQYLSYFQSINCEAFETFLKAKSIDSVKNSKPLNILTIIDNKGNKNKVKFYARKAPREGTLDEKGNVIIYDPVRMNAFVENSNDFLIVQYYIFGKLMPPADYFYKSNMKLSKD